MTIEEIKPHLNYSIVEVCRVLGVSRRKVDYLREKGVIQWYIRRADSAIRIKGKDVIKFYNS